jgi:hypothetical protein
MNTTDEKTRDTDDDGLIALARHLPRAMAPGRDLWPGIAEAIAADEQPRGTSWRWQKMLAYAAGVLLLVGGSSGVTWLAVTGKQPQYAAAQTVEPLQLQPVSGSFGGHYELGPEFIAARNSLASELDGKLDRLSPQARAEVEKNIAESRASIQQINRVLSDEPDNALLQQLLLTAYHDELNMMRRVDGLISTVMNREDI